MRVLVNKAENYLTINRNTNVTKQIFINGDQNYQFYTISMAEFVLTPHYSHCPNTV